jgi:hypothetical protein
MKKCVECVKEYVKKNNTKYPLYMVKGYTLIMLDSVKSVINL